MSLFSSPADRKKDRDRNGLIQTPPDSPDSPASPHPAFPVAGELPEFLVPPAPGGDRLEDPAGHEPPQGRVEIPRRGVPPQLRDQPDHGDRPFPEPLVPRCRERAGLANPRIPAGLPGGDVSGDALAVGADAVRPIP